MPALPTAEMRSLGINPGNIRHIFFPSSNYINIPPFMKWLHNREGKLSVYSDRPEDWDRIKKIFPRAGLNLLPFCDMKVQTDERISIENISRSFNLKVTMTDASGGKINLAYLKGTGQAREILKEHLDGVLVPYSVFEDITLLFKSSGTPVAIIDDGNPRVSRVPILDHIVLFRGIQYEIQCSCDQSFLASLLLPEGTDCEKIAQKDLSSINDIFSRDNSNRDFQVRLFNLLSVVRMFLFGTTDRAYASELKKLCQDLMACINSTVVELAGEQYRVLLLFSNKTIIQFLQPLPADEHGIQDYSSPSFEKRIAEDRERLLLLLKLLMGRESRHKSAAHVDELVTAIQTRKELYRDNGMPGYEGYPSSIPDSEKTHVPGLSIAEEKLRGLNLRQKILAPGKRKYLAGVSLFCTILLALAITMLLRPDKKNKVPGPPATVAATVEDKRIIDKFAITVTDTDIYEYANQVARKNGYSPISMTDLKRMNPNWIYPSNVFILLDGEKIVVQKGDTLWDLAHSKLLRLNIEFFRVLERLEKSPENEWPGIISEAERYALTGRNRRILAEKKGTLLNGAKR